MLALTLLAALAPDATCATALAGGTLTGPGNAPIHDSLSPTDASDHLRMTLGPLARARVRAEFDHDDGDLQLRLWNADCTVVLATSTSGTDDELVWFGNQNLFPIEIVAEVYVDQPLASEVPYTWQRNAQLLNCLGADAFEPNQSCAAAAILPSVEDEPYIAGLSLSPSDEDWYSFEVPPTSEVWINIISLQLEGETDVELWSDDCATLLQSYSAPGTESLVIPNATDLPAPYALRIFRSDAAPACSEYFIQRGIGYGVSECSSVPNSSGLAAEISVIGFLSTPARPLWLFADHTPFETFGILVFGPDAGSTPLGNGTLCIDTAQLTRGRVYQGFEFTINFIIDLSDPAPGAGPILPGDTLRFQGWFRDPLDPTGFGLTDATRMTFTP